MQKKKKKTAGDRIRLIIVLILSIVIGFCGAKLTDFWITARNNNKGTQEIKQVIADNDVPSTTASPDDGTFHMTRQAWDALKQQYPEMMAYMAFPDEFVSEPVAHPSQSNPMQFLRHWFDGSYNALGVVFIDANNALTDTNMVLYGHSSDYDLHVRFSALTQLTDQSMWDAHHEFTVWYDDRIATYKIVAVNNLDTYSQKAEDWNFTQANFNSQEDLDRYMGYVKEGNLINPGEDSEINYGDRFLSLQTCKRYNSRYHIILTCKQISETDWNGDPIDHNN